MLNKDICIKCINQQVSLTNSPWYADDEHNWLKGCVNCVSRVDVNKKYTAYVKEEPPKGCFYALEHIVLGEKPNVK